MNNSAERWIESGAFEVLPEVISERYTTIETIDRYIFCENKVLRHEKHLISIYRLCLLMVIPLFYHKIWVRHLNR